MRSQFDPPAYGFPPLRERRGRGRRSIPAHAPANGQGGIALLMATGHMMAPSFGGVMQTQWIRWSYMLVIGSGAIWLFILVPVQFMQARMLKPLGPQPAIPDGYRKLSLLWMVAGTAATLLPMPAIYFMAAKPVM